MAKGEDYVSISCARRLGPIYFQLHGCVGSAGHADLDFEWW
jgi:hypothetical protein